MKSVLNVGKVTGRSGCSPRTRGWSARHPRHPQSQQVLPAHAGMVRDGHPGSAYWSDRPEETFEQDWKQDWETASWAQEYSASSRSEWSGYRILPNPLRYRWAGRMTDGTTVWFGGERGETVGWYAWTGDSLAEEPSLPGFFSRPPGYGPALGQRQPVPGPSARGGGLTAGPRPRTLRFPGRRRHRPIRPLRRRLRHRGR